MVGAAAMVRADVPPRTVVAGTRLAPPRRPRGRVAGRLEQASVTALDAHVAVVLGARNLGGAIIDHLQENGWRGAAVARARRPRRR